ncbi:glycerate kinase type-2 family protein [Paracoccus sp. (in: a-proteobacteria)]|uniref:glycerate kinase type-2 family protein n=1 Tax=Paracoccus sp. TaxID=267 RepID=UPI00405930E5
MQAEPNTKDMRALARHLYDVAVGAADPARAVRAHFERHPPAALHGRRQHYLIAIGKAAPAMLAEAMRRVPPPFDALAVTHHENSQTVPGARVLKAGHPVPDAAGLHAGQQIAGLLAGAGADDHVYALVSGGGSALVPAPVPPLTLQDKQQVNRVLLESGLDIASMNLVRQQLSTLKGGGFLRLAAPAPVTALILSDVIGNDLAAIASGPTTAPLGSRADALALLRRHGLFDRLPLPVRELLETPREPSRSPDADNHLIGSNDLSLQAMQRAVPDGWTARIVSDHLTGDVGDAARRVITAARDTSLRQPTALIFGGETTVRLRGDGRGGRNQELALRVAMQGGDLPPGWVFLSGGTDGRDGPTDAAGGLVDQGTAGRIAASGADAAALLANNDSYAALKHAGDLLVTRATGTNVADVQVMLLTP